MGIKEKTASGGYGAFKSVLLDNKKEIIETYKELYTQITRPITGAISSVMVKSSISSMVSALLQILAESANLSIIETILAVIKWGLIGFTTLTASGMIAIEVKNTIRARSDYENLCRMAMQMCEDLDDITLDLISTNGSAYSMQKENADNNIKGVYTYWEGKNIVQIEMDEFIWRCFELEEQLLSRGYPGCQEDAMALQRLVKNYASAKPEFKNLNDNEDPKKQLFDQTLNAIEQKIIMKLDSNYGYTIIQEEDILPLIK